MTSRKRPAEEQLLIFRNSKQPRRTMKGYDGGAPSPSGDEGRLASWTRQLTVIYQTFSFMPRSTPGANSSESATQEDALSNSSVSSESFVATPHQTPAPEQVAVVLSDGEHSSEERVLGSLQSIDFVPDSKPTPLQTYFSSRPSSFASSSKSSSRTPSSSLNDPFGAASGSSIGFARDTFQSTPKPRNAVASSSRTPTEVFPPLSRSITKEPTEKFLLKIEDLRLGSSTHTSLQSTPLKAVSSTSLKRPSMMQKPPLRLTSRQHIYAKAHKADVQRKNEELKEQMARHLWEKRKRRGFSSNFQDFKGLLGYKEELLKQLGQTPQIPQLPLPLKTRNLQSPHLVSTLYTSGYAASYLPRMRVTQASNE
ncbi:hypothetical protein CPB83DRAFT_18905 [Crepidotus variabilis]|uniref:Uncharacterized protein n=1 Tax=Crepidotus variabilis TaxID=179855 RepID=A0A9P6EVI6_9AGAR|nr:hypothetical protein CPB83DRAFT_18905 [Crepidotus variabilis]